LRAELRPAGRLERRWRPQHLRPGRTPQAPLRRRGGFPVRLGGGQARPPRRERRWTARLERWRVLPGLPLPERLAPGPRHELRRDPRLLADLRGLDLEATAEQRALLDSSPTLSLLP